MQRRGHVPGTLPERMDFTVYIHLTDVQYALYEGYLVLLKPKPTDESKSEPKAKKPKRTYFLNYNFLRRIWAHPRLLLSFEKKMEKTHSGDAALPDFLDKCRQHGYLNDALLKDNALSGKLMFVLSLIRECQTVGDKILIFTQCIESIELLRKAILAEMSRHGWEEGVNFLVISGEVCPEDRKTIEDTFHKNSEAKLVIFSTKAGSVETNFQAANRVVIFDVSPNPTNDEQATYRVYRIGQTKPQTLEERNYRRQVVEISIVKGVENDDQVDRYYTSEELDELYKTLRPMDNSSESVKTTGDMAFDMVFQDTRNFVHKWESHEIKFGHKEELELTAEEKEDAKREYAREAAVHGIKVDFENATTGCPESSETQQTDHISL